MRDFQSVIGREVKKQIMGMEGRLPDYLVACVGGGSNAIGLFHPFLEYDNIRMIGAEAGGLGLSTGRHAARFSGGKERIVEGYRSLFLQNSTARPLRPFSGGRTGLHRHRSEHAYLKSMGRVDISP